MVDVKTELIPLIGDPQESLYQLGLKERSSFLEIESRVLRLLSTSSIMRQGHDIINRARTLLKKKSSGPFLKAIGSYAEGLGIETHRYLNFLSLFELAAHHGQAYPELKGLLPGCTSVLSRNKDGVTHTRLMDFPLLGVFEARPRLYYWQCPDSPTILSYSCEGMAPLFFQAIHGQGISFALHHKPGKNFHRDGESVFEIAFETLFASSSMADFKKDLRRRSSMTKWSFILLDHSGENLVVDIDGPSSSQETFSLTEEIPLIFTNIPLQKDPVGFESYLQFSSERQSWAKRKLESKAHGHILDQMTDVEDQSEKSWIHPAATLSTVAAYHVNLTQGYVDLKEGESALVKSDAIVRLSLSQQSPPALLKAPKNLGPFEEAWKRAAKAQALFDEGDIEGAYHELQMAEALMPSLRWKQILRFYLCVWDFKFVSHHKEISMIYRRLKELKLPPILHDQWALMCMRFERRLGLVLTVTAEDLSAAQRPLFERERLAPRPVFSTWMSLLYPRLEILDVFSPHHQ